MTGAEMIVIGVGALCVTVIQFCINHAIELKLTDLQEQVDELRRNQVSK